RRGHLAGEPRAYFRSMRRRTASATFRSERSSANGMRVTGASLQGAKCRAARARGRVRRSRRRGRRARALPWGGGRDSPWSGRRGRRARSAGGRAGREQVAETRGQLGVVDRIAYTTTVHPNQENRGRTYVSEG